MWSNINDLSRSILETVTYILKVLRSCGAAEPFFPGALGVVTLICKFSDKQLASLLVSSGLKKSVHKYYPPDVPLAPSCIIQWANANGVSSDKSIGTIFSLLI